MPANPKRPKSKKLNTSNKKRWQEILKGIDKQEVPIHVLDKLAINLHDGTSIIIEIKRAASITSCSFFVSCDEMCFLLVISCNSP